MLTISGISRKYGSLKVVDNVSMQVQKGELVSIVGPSGAGKSTLLHIAGALDKPDSGSVLVSGTDMHRLPAAKQARFRNNNLGFVFQFHHLLPEFSALENVCLPLWIRGAGRKQATKDAAELLDITGLGGRMNHKPAQLSGGEQQRVAIARALAGKPGIVLADEPTGNLDTANAHAVHQLFLDLRIQLGQTFLIITHNPALAAMTDRTLTMMDGRIVSEQVNAGNEAGSR